MSQTHNAKIESTMMGPEGHGIMTVFLHLSYGKSSGQGFGGYDLRAGDALTQWVQAILKVADVEKWEDLPGKYIRVEREDGFNGMILRIGHFLDEDIWFNPRKI